MSQPVDPSSLDRIMQSLRAIIQAEMFQVPYLGLYEYTIQAATSSTVDGTPTDTSIPMPSVTGVPLRSSVLGATATPTVGGRCLIMFVGGDPTRPICVSTDPIPVIATVDASSAVNVGPSATAVVLAGGGPAVGRVGDVVHVTFTLLDASAITANLSTGICSITAPLTLTGTITSGSSKVSSG